MSRSADLPPWGFDADVGDDIRHMWYKLILVARAAEAEAQQIEVDFKRNMQYKKVG